MEWKERTPSVIARLMGLDEFSPPQSTTTQRRLLSESYMKKVASIGVRERRSSYVRCSFKMGIGVEKEIKKAIESLEALQKNMHHQLPVEKTSNFMISQLACTTYSLVDSKHVSIQTKLRDLEEFHNSMELTDSKDVSARYLQKPDLMYTKNLHKLQGVPSNFLSGNTEGLNTSCALNHRSINRFRKSGKILEQGNIGILRTSSDSPKGYKSSSSCPDGLNVAREAKNIISERLKGMRKFQEFGQTPKSNMLGEVVAMSDQGIKPRKLDYSLINCHRSNQSCYIDGDLNIATPLGIAQLGCIMLADKDDNSSQVQDFLFQQEDACDGFPEECSVSSQCSGTDPGSLLSSEDAYQRSPNSVLEMSCSTGRFERAKADLYDSSEELSEGPGMNVSSDEDNEEGSTAEDESLMRFYNVEESRDFSYLVDVLTEAGFCGRSLDTWQCHSPECPISPLVFETLEKKYGEQVSWTRSERKLLLDRMSSGLKEILRPCMGVTKPLADRLSFSRSWGMIEEKLWKMMANQEREVTKKALGEGLIEGKKLVGREREEKRASYEKAMKGDAWLTELGEEVEDIGKEVERMLVDEIVAEAVLEFSTAGVFLCSYKFIHF